MFHIPCFDDCCGVVCQLKGFSESSARGIVESFNIAHTEAVDRLSDMSFIPKSFNPLVEEKRKQKSQDSAKASVRIF